MRAQRHIAGCLALVLALVLALPALAAPERGVSAQARERIGGKRVALVIGNGAYQDSPLRNPVNDAQAMAQELRGLGFQVIEGVNLDLAQMKRAVWRFGQKLGSRSVGLFYYAGHGMQAGGRNYLVPVNARLQSERDLELEGLDLGYVLAEMHKAGNRLNLVILDACRDNPYARSWRGGGQGLASMDAPTGTLIAFATSPGRVAADGAGQHGVYTQHLLKHLPRPGLSVEKVFKLTRADVLRHTNGRQVPWESSSLVGDFYFASARGVARAREKVDPPPPLPAKTAHRNQVVANDLGMNFVLMPAGRFTMGAGDGSGGHDEDEAPARSVRLSQPFYIQTAEVTQGQWRRIMHANPALLEEGDRLPVNNVSWYEVAEFIKKLNAQDPSRRYRLPSEAEWEYACRRGREDSAKTYRCNSGQRAPEEAARCGINAWGGSDMLGNVWEWTANWYSSEYYQYGSRRDPKGPLAGRMRVIRGGCWLGPAWELRCANREGLLPGGRNRYTGFRLVMESD